MINLVKSFFSGLYELIFFILQIWKEKIELAYSKFKKKLPWLMQAPDATLAIMIGTLFNDLEPIEKRLEKRLNACYTLLLKKEKFDVKDKEWNETLMVASFRIHTADIFLFPGLRSRIIDESVKRLSRKIRWDLAIKSGD
jgi:hypothetical protein